MPGSFLAERPPLIVHVLYRFDTGGLENGIVNLINRMPVDAYRHVIVALTEAAPAFVQRIRRPDVELIELHKPPGHSIPLYPRLARLFSSLQPAVVHTRNLAALECQVPAAWARVPVRIHGEHGRDVSDLDGSNPRYQWIRRLYRPFVHQYVALSRDLEGYLVDRVGIAAARVTQIYNGVDTDRFGRLPVGRVAPIGSPFGDPGLFVVGTVGRMQTVKAQTDLAKAFVRALQLRPELRTRLRLAMVGDGPVRSQAQQWLDQAGVADLAWLPGERADVPDVMRGLDCFVLPSLAEGISNTILEAMACGLPVLATDVGGNAELVSTGQTGLVVPAADVEAMAQALLALADDTPRAVAFGQAGRTRVEQKFSLQAMVGEYQGLYDRLLNARQPNARQN